jgi:hypothetical protein
MKTFFLVAIGMFGFLIMHASSVDAQDNQIQNYEGMAILPSTYGDLICLGSWNSDTRRCDGSAVSSGALAAISAAKSVDKLEQIRLLLDEVKNGISANTQALRGIQKSINLQDHPTKESIKRAINSRFAAIPAGVLTDDSVRGEIEKLKENILHDVDKMIPEPPGSPGK